MPSARRWPRRSASPGRGADQKASAGSAATVPTDSSDDSWGAERVKSIATAIAAASFRGGSDSRPELARLAAMSFGRG
jgi:hypothetical protein